jgi:hypothetical protein
MMLVILMCNIGYLLLQDSVLPLITLLDRNRQTLICRCQKHQHYSYKLKG